MKVLYVASDRPGAGKTVTAMALVAALRQRGVKVGYFKPFCTDPHCDADVDFATGVAEGRSGFRVLKPVDLRLEALAHPTPAVVVERVEARMAEAAGRDVLVVEGASLSVGDEDLSDISYHVVQGLNARVLGIVGYEPGTYVEGFNRMLETFGESLAGVFVNRATRHRAHEVAKSIVDGKSLGVTPEDRLMVAASLNQIAEALEGRWVWGEEQGERLVEQYLIGGNLMDSGDSYFNRMDKKAVIVRGDRPDIQLSALTGPVVGLINTGGHEPVEYLLHEVEQLDVPLMVTPYRTAEAVEALGGALKAADPYHPEKIARFLQMLRDYCDIDAVLEGVL